MQPRGSPVAGRPSAGAACPRRGDCRRTPGRRCARRHRLDLPAASCRHPEPREGPASPRAPAPPAELNQEARSRGGRRAAAAGTRRRPSARPALRLRRRGARRQPGASDGEKSCGDGSRSASPPPAPGRTRPCTALSSAREQRRAPPGQFHARRLQRHPLYLSGGAAASLHAAASTPLSAERPSSASPGRAPRPSAKAVRCPPPALPRPRLRRGLQPCRRPPPSPSPSPAR